LTERSRSGTMCREMGVRMARSVDLTNPIFTDLEAARRHFEAIRWPKGPYCPYCGGFDRVAPLGGKSMGPGWYHCKDCRRKFTAAVGTIYERSHIPMTKWLLATHLMCASKKAMSAHQLHRMIGLPYKTAWFMAHRIREGMRELNTPLTPLGGNGKIVEADETYIGGKETNKHRSKRNSANIGGMGKEIAFALVERGGRIRTQHVPEVTAKTLREILVRQLSTDARLMTDDAGQYRHMHRDFRHQVVNHGIGEYVRGDAHTNTVEGYFAILKRGITGTYHHVSQQHLKRYLAEFDFRYNERSALGVSDAERATKAVKGVVGKRVTYQGTNGSYPEMAN
jgi:transposase-like protein